MRRIHTQFLSLLGVLVFSSLCLAQLPSAKQEAEIGKKADALIAKMTLTEKLDLLGGTGFGSKALKRLGIPSIEMIDGPQGIRGPRATAFPSSMATLATWNPQLMREVSAAIGREVRAIGKNMILGPCVSFYRVPQSGRNFECFGEDPVLNARFAAAYVMGAHDSKILTATKHFLLNDQEINRHWVDVHVDERALQELELPGYIGAIEAGTESIMSSYNLVDGLHSAENPRLLTGLLKEKLGFKGFVVSDWESTYNGWNAAMAGLDLEMPYGDHMNASLKQKIDSGDLSVAQINDKVRRILRALYLIGEMDPKARKATHPASGLNSAENRAVALKIAEEAIVLLKNDKGLLPLKPSEVKSIAVVGPGAAARRFHGGGSGEVSAALNISTLDGIKANLKPEVKINFAKGIAVPGQIELVEVFRPELEGGTVDGFKAEYFDNNALHGTPIITRQEPDIQIWNTVTPDPKLHFDKYSARFSGKFVNSNSGPTLFDFGVTGRGYRFYLDGKLLKDLFNDKDAWESSVAVTKLEAGTHEIKVEYRNTADNFRFRLSWLPPAPKLAEAIEAARKSDVAIVVVGTSGVFEDEELDRPDIKLPGEQDKFIESILEANPRTIVVVNSGGPVLMRAWRDRAPAIIQAWFAGQEAGRAVGEILLGKVNPSGKLPYTMPRDLKESPSATYYKGQKEKIDYSTVSILEGYRGYDANGIAPEFPFGHGLSYTQFAYSDMSAQVEAGSTDSIKVKVSLMLKNTGAVAGAETVQLYVHQEAPTVKRPPRELKDFQKILLAPGESKVVSFDLDSKAFRYWDLESHGWKVDPGGFVISLGSSSRDLKIESRVQIGQ